MGDSRGRWEDNALVVDVTLFNDQTWFDRAGNFHSDALHVVERYTRTDADHLLYEATIEDPKVFTRPWTMRMPLYRRQDANAQLLEFECYVVRPRRSVVGCEVALCGKEHQMRIPGLTGLRVIATLCAVVYLSGGEASSQAPQAGAPCPAEPALFHSCALARAKTFVPPRTPDGQPDLQGIWRGMASGTENIEEHPKTGDDDGGKSLVVDPPSGKVPYQDWAAGQPPDEPPDVRRAECALFSVRRAAIDVRPDADRDPAVGHPRAHPL